MTRQQALAYAAGMFDGEGHIYLPAKRRSLCLDVSNTHEGVIDWFVENFGGKKLVCEDKRPNRQILYRWRAYNKTAREFLTVTKPYRMVRVEDG
jgi:hypothetical protein